MFAMPDVKVTYYIYESAVQGFGNSYGIFMWKSSSHV